jgi:hypothetical protein
MVMAGEWGHQTRFLSGYANFSIDRLQGIFNHHSAIRGNKSAQQSP